MYRNILAVIAAIAIASPVFAEDATSTPAAAPDSGMTSQTVEKTTTTTTDTSTATSSKVNINKASAKELMKLKGMNARKAKAIVAYRKKHGDFKSTDDLSKVHGFHKMKSSRLQAIQSQLSAE